MNRIWDIEEYEMFFDEVSSGLYCFSSFVLGSQNKAEDAVSRIYLQSYKLILKDRGENDPLFIIYRTLVSFIRMENEGESTEEKMVLFLYVRNKFDIKSISKILSVSLQEVSNYLKNSVKNMKKASYAI